MNDIQLPRGMTKPEDNEALAQEIADLEQRLAAAKARAKERDISLPDDGRQQLQTGKGERLSE